MMEDVRCKKEEVFDGRCIQMFDVLWMMEEGRWKRLDVISDLHQLNI